jgi:hypothetical protein
MSRLPRKIVNIIKDVIENTQGNLESMKKLGTDYYKDDRYEFLKQTHKYMNEDFPYDRDIQTLSVQIIQMYLFKEIYMIGVNQKESKNHNIIKEKQ